MHICRCNLFFEKVMPNHVPILNSSVEMLTLEMIIENEKVPCKKKRIKVLCWVEKKEKKVDIWCKPKV